MKKIEIEASFGNKKKAVQIVQPAGAGGLYQILISNYYHGTVSKINGEWVAHLNAKSELTGDDIQIITDLIEKNAEK
jgi:hypothetical protein